MKKKRVPRSGGPRALLFGARLVRLRDFGQIDAKQGRLRRFDQRVLPPVALAAEVVVVDRPEHDPAQIVVRHVLCLSTNIKRCVTIVNHKK